MADARGMRRPRNAALWIGGVLTLAVALLAWLGPLLAPRDPLKQQFIIENTATGRFIRPPLPAFTVPGYPLGTDVYGRDVLSQLLWSLGPTLTLAVVVAGARLALGLALGLAAGWLASARGLVGRALDQLIAAALAAPVLFVALFVLAALSIFG